MAPDNKVMIHLNSLYFRLGLGSVVFLFLFFSSLSLGADTKMNNQAPLTIALPPVDYEFDSTKINSVSDHLILSYLSRPLVTFNSSGGLKADLAESWDVSDDHLTYSFKLKRNQIFSDGSEIVAQDVVASIGRAKKHPKSVHYNFGQIKEVKALSKYEVEFVLKEPAPFFLYDLEHPELMVYHKSDYNAEMGKQSFQTVSGSHTIGTINKSSKNLVLNKNKKFQLGQSDFDQVNLLSFTNEKEDRPKIQKQEIDIYWAPSSASDEFHAFLQNQGYQIYKPRLGFSFWMSINPTNIKEIKVRHWLQAQVHKKMKLFSTNPSYSLSNQLFLPGGPGRPSEDFVSGYWKKVEGISLTEREKPKSLSLLIYKGYEFKDQILSTFKNLGIKIKVTEYAQFGEYQKLIADKDKFDLIQANNDFSSLDLRGSLNVTFNEGRPLIMNETKQIEDLLTKANLELDDAKRFGYIEGIGKAVLTEGYVIPINYFNTVIYHKKNISLDNWSSITPDFTLWKIKKRSI